MKNPKKTATRIAREKRDEAIRKEFAELIAIEGSMATAVYEHIENKYNVGHTTVWRIINK